jgi:integrase
VKGKEPSEKKAKYLNEFELKLLLRHLDLSTFPSFDWLILVIAKTGLRFGEALGLTKNDIDLEHQTINVDKTWDYKSYSGGFRPTKNTSSVRKVSIDWKLAMQLNQVIQDFPEDKPLFAQKRVFNSTVNNILKKYCEELGITVISVHGLRHTHASLLLFAGVSIASVAKRLGHADMTTTQQTYLHIIQELENKDNSKIMQHLASL